MASPQFNPAEVAYVESPVELPAYCRGRAEITNEIPTRIMISAQMETPGLIVLADNWDKGWRAYWNGRPVPVLRADYTPFAAWSFPPETGRWNSFTDQPA